MAPCNFLLGPPTTVINGTISYYPLPSCATLKPAGTREVGGLDLLLVYVDETTNNCDPASDNK